MHVVNLVTNLYRFLEMDKATSLKRDFRMLKDGFFSKRRGFYPFHKFHKSLFLTDWEIETKFSRINTKFSQEKLRNKLFFQLLLKEAGLQDSLPGLIGTVENGRYQSFSGALSLEEVIGSEHRVFIKPILGSGGRDCFIVRRIEDIPTIGHYLIEKCALAHPYSYEIFPHALNTVRMLTLKNRSGEPFIVGAVHRFGANAEEPIDNFSRGGVACGIDLLSGVLSAGVTNPEVFSVNWHDSHPTTYKPLTGVKVPFWQAAKDLVTGLASYFQDLNYAGWDIYISPVGPKIIEGNGGIANPNLIQVHAPILESVEVRDQLLKFGALSKRRWTKISEDVGSLK